VDSRLSAFLERADAVLARLEPLLPAPRQAIDWDQCLAARWQREGRSGFLLPLDVSLDMRLSDLIGVDKQRETLARNTQQFLDGLPANHALLWGSRGTGKSSMVRALLAQPAKAGTKVADKVGFLGDTNNDAGIVTLPDGEQYILVVTTHGAQPGGETGFKHIAQITQHVQGMVYNPKIIQDLNNH